MNLLQALNSTEPLCTAVVGAGGKTTTAFQLARQVQGLAWVTTTTHLGTDQTHYADRHFVLKNEDDFQTEAFKQQKVTLLTGLFSADERIHSPEPELLERMHLTAERDGISLLIEADGSRSIPLKAPGEHEPPIPAWVTSVIVLVGISVLGRTLSPETVFRAERYSELTSLQMGQTVTIESISRMLVHPLGGLKNIPAGALKAVLFNQADNERTRSAIRTVVPSLLEGGYDRVIIGGLKSGPDTLECFSKD